jgi:hypothetical protein
MHHLI